MLFTPACCIWYRNNTIQYRNSQCTKWLLESLAQYNQFFVAVLDFAILVCRRYGHAFCRRLGMSPFWGTLYLGEVEK